ncbi:hypothetical protein LEP1GSC059_2729 [Leptospira noguchii serovar Panama str. CZ214]|uniref:Uncharacterized protein n=1 Tax=Leptospira noguchii serovar Panama str. CZ214 TaxID=1001595 RepID=T0FMX1_9LEPT|nr:hypothetical protein LEP1GSC059_2729 [Leptospira noguchii serovar Panama str. CZ214]
MIHRGKSSHGDSSPTSTQRLVGKLFLTIQKYLEKHPSGKQEI